MSTYGFRNGIDTRRGPVRRVPSGVASLDLSIEGATVPAKSEFSAVFKDLRAILAAYEPKLKVVHDTADNYYLDTHTVGQNKKPIMFAGVRVNKNYVSYYLMAVYAQTGM